MESDNSTNIMKTKKQPHEAYKFFINHNEEGNQYLHLFLGSPQLLQIGKYANDSYDFAPTEGLVALKLKHTIVNESNAYTTDNGISVTLPNEVISILSNLDIDKGTNKSSQPYYSTEYINFYWCIVNDVFPSKGDSTVLNISPHTFLFTDIDFSKTKRMVRNTPICLVEADNSGHLRQFENKKDSKFNCDIMFNRLRIEYSSMHMIKQCLGFSPNNLKFVVRSGGDVVQFYVIVLDEMGIANSVFYFWLWERRDINIGDILSSSNDIDELLENVRNLVGKAECIETVNKIFKG
jgi:hypothetical protein